MSFKLDFLKDDYNERIYDLLSLVGEENNSIVDVLVSMQKEKGIDELQALNNARACYQSTLIKKKICSDMILAGERAEAAGENYIDNLSNDFKKLDPKSRRHSLEAICYALSYEKSSAYGNKAKFAFDRDSFFSKTHVSDFTDAELEKKAEELIDDLSFSPEYIKYTLSKMELSKYCNDMESLDDKDTAIKCFLAMELYLENENSSLEEAINAAILASEIEGLNRDVSNGLLKREKARKIVKWLLIGLIAATVICVIAVTCPEIFAFFGEFLGIGEAAAAGAEAAVLTVPTPVVFQEIAGPTMSTGVVGEVTKTIGEKITNLIVSAIGSCSISCLFRNRKDMEDVYSHAMGKKAMIENSDRKHKNSIDAAVDALEDELEKKEELRKQRASVSAEDQYASTDEADFEADFETEDDCDDEDESDFSF